MEANMKSYKEYLTESKKTYEYKVKIAGDIPADFATNLKAALSQFNVEAIKNAKRTPIQESPIDFPNVKFQEVTVFDVALTYPTISPVIANVIRTKLGIPEKHIVVRTLGEEQETELNVQYMHGLETTETKNPDEALLNTPYVADDYQDMVGDKKIMSFLKTLEKHDLEEYKGVNDQLFAGMPKLDGQQVQSKETDKSGMGSVLTKQVKLTPHAQGRHPGIKGN